MYTYNMVKEKEDTAFLHIRIKKELLDEARRKAEKGDLTLSQVVRILISEWVSSPQQKLFF
jgi:antitoxin component of RelBE/YafQ-DinJ toxin-antitoxin module